MKHLHHPFDDQQGWQWSKRVGQHCGISLLVGGVATIAVFSLWHQLSQRENLQIERLVQQEEATIVSEFGLRLQTRVDLLERMANRWQRNEGTPQTVWEADATALIADFPELRAIEWVDSSLQPRWMVAADSAIATNLDLSQNPYWRVTLQTVMAHRQTRFSRPLSLGADEMGVLVVVPLLVEGLPGGFIIGTFALDDLMPELLLVPPGYQVTLNDGNTTIYGEPEPGNHRYQQLVTITDYSAHWQMKLWPTPTLLAERRSRLPEVVLVGGILGAWGLALTIALGQRAGRFARHTRIINQQLQAEIAQRQQIEEHLRHQKEILQAMIDHIPIMITLFNSEGRIEFINPEVERVLGWSMVDFHQQNILMEAYPDPIYRQIVINHMLSAIGTWRDLTTLNARGDRLETSWASVRLSDGRFLGIGQDISDRKQTERALRQAMEAAEAANLAKSAFLANMSHELRTPLNVILGFTQLMEHDPSLRAAQLEDIQTIRKSGEYLLSLINDVLDLSKIEAGHCALEEDGFDLIALLHTLRTMMAERARAKHLNFEFTISADVPQFILADEQKIRQILLNLLSNAIKFTSQGTIKLEVKVARKFLEPPSATSPASNLSPSSPHQTMLSFSVSDTGIGIASEEFDTIFDAFVQAQRSQKTIGGTGLGLTISRRLAELMDGSITVHSTLNVGSRFTLMVPVKVISSIDAQTGGSDRQVVGIVPGQPHHRILVVDDQVENRQLLVRLLTEIGLEVRAAATGYEAIQIWQDWRPSLIWMDIRMPGMDGYEATSHIRALEQETASVIIALTAQASQSDRTLALAVGCNDYISKPFQEVTLFQKMHEYLGLEYLYAEVETPDEEPVMAPPSCPEDLPVDVAKLASLPEDWLLALENAVVRGDDRAIATLVTQLPANLDALAKDLTELAEKYQFEQILNLLHHIFNRVE